MTACIFYIPVERAYVRKRYRTAQVPIAAGLVIDSSLFAAFSPPTSDLAPENCGGASLSALSQRDGNKL
jgi:hypothetical protein